MDFELSAEFRNLRGVSSREKASEEGRDWSIDDISAVTVFL